VDSASTTSESGVSKEIRIGSKLIHSPLMTQGVGSRSCLNLRDRILRSLQQPLHFLHINFRRRIMLVPHHLCTRVGFASLSKAKVGVECHKLGNDNTRLLHASEEQSLRNDPVNRAWTAASPLPLPRCRRDHDPPWSQTVDHFPVVDQAGTRDTSESTHHLLQHLHRLIDEPSLLPTHPQTPLVTGH